MSTIAGYYLKVEPAGPINPPPLITGHDLVRLGLEPGAQFATILEQVREAQLEGQTPDQGERRMRVGRRQRLTDFKAARK